MALLFQIQIRHKDFPSLCTGRRWESAKEKSSGAHIMSALTQIKNRPREMDESRKRVSLINSYWGIEVEIMILCATHWPLWWRSIPPLLPSAHLSVCFSVKGGKGNRTSLKTNGRRQQDSSDFFERRITERNEMNNKTRQKHQPHGSQLPFHWRHYRKSGFAPEDRERVVT